ncbi:hypothetical protein NliqN6_2477 [Naganishia liquefaciens]|uniref:DNA polymerase lambda n=1 Tax=Naganishia liquefaciens TaxID=104408 RepID=A0A8H3TRW3_9TREE|nr:hypothetical protein NliqN6_2477 [Naganishia liquefaciens]
MDPLDFDEDDLHETRAERLEYDEEMKDLLLRSWEEQETMCDGEDIHGIVDGCEASIASIDGAPATPPLPRKPQAVVPTAKTADPQEVTLPMEALLVEKHSLSLNSDGTEKPSTSKDVAKARYLQQLGKRVNSTSGISRSKTTVEISASVAEGSLGLDAKGKKKAPSLSALIPLAMDPPLPPSTSISTAVPASKPIKVSPKLQIVLDNHANFLLAIQDGVKPKITRRRGLLAMDKINLARLSKVFDGCVVAVVHHLSAKPEQLVTRWALVHQHGGQVCVRYSPGVTHVACDHDVNDAALCEYLGINEISDLPKDLPVLSWDWFVQCQSSRQLLAPGMFLRPCLRTQVSGSRRLSSTTSIGKGKRKSEVDLLAATALNKRSKKYAPTDSDTSQSQRNSRYMPAQRYATSPEPMDEDERRAATGMHGGDGTGNRDELPSGAEHERWKLPAVGEAADPLDELITGFKEGTLIETDQDLAEEAALIDHHKRSMDKLSQMFENSQDGLATQKSQGPYKCQHANPGGTKQVSVNEDIARGLESLAKTYENAQHKNEFQKRSNLRAAGIIRNHPYRITSGKQALKLKFIGVNIADRIDEIIRNGGISDREIYEDNTQARTVAMFGDIYGVGTRRANEFWNQGARSLDDLRSGSWALSEAQKMGLKYYDDLKQRIPRAEVTRLFESIKRTAEQLDGCGDKKNDKLCVEAMGSYRRGEETSGDLDILITRDVSAGNRRSSILGDLITRLIEKSIICHTLSAPSNYADVEAKWMGLGRVLGADGKPEGPMRRIDILMVPWENYGAALIYFTGNDIFNRSLRLFARRNGYSLNQRGLYKGTVRDEKGKKTTEGVLVASRTEQEIFDTLNVRYRPPHLRRP